MSEPKKKPESLKEMTEAAAEAMLFHPHDGNYTRLAKVALEAADVPELLARIAKLEAANAKLKARLGKELGWVNN